MPFGELRELEKWFPRSYEHGPFLTLLRTNFARALRIISSLVSFATDRFCERAERRIRAARSAAEQDGTNSDLNDMLEALVELPNGPHRYRGNEVVYGWSSGGHAPNSVAAALMALEKYFYDRLATSADVSGDLNLVLTETNSVAFLKVLCEVGKMRPELFEGALLPLFGSPELYLWDRVAVAQGKVRLADLLPEFAEPKTSAELQTFRALEHRKQTFLDTAARAMLFRPPATAFFEQACQRWAVDLTKSSPIKGHLLEELLLMLDRTNYTQVSEEAFRNVALQALQSRQRHDTAEIERRALLSYFPLTCRKLLDDDTVLNQSDRDTHWRAWTQIRARWNQAMELHGGSPVASTDILSPAVAGIALLLRQPGWADDHREEAGECIKALEEALTQAPAFDAQEDGGFPNALAWSYFAAEALSAVWARSERHPRLLLLTGLFILKASRLAAGRLFIGLSHSRTSRPSDFEAIRKLAIEWAHVRPAAAILSRRSTKADDQTSALRLGLSNSIDAWIASQLEELEKGSPQRIRSARWIFSGWAPSEEANAWLRRQGWTPGPDLEFIKSVHDWMPGLNDAISQDEREGWITFLREGLGVVLANVNSKLSNKRDHKWPTPGEDWFLRRTAIAVLDMTAAERPEVLWRPLLALPNLAKEWVSRFLRALHREALSRQQTPGQYTSLVRSIVDDAVAERSDRERWGYHNGAWDALIGIQGRVRFDEPHSPLREAWEPRHSTLLEKLAPVFDTWMAAVPIAADRFQTVALWLARPAAAPVRLRFLSWLHSSILTYEAHEMPDSHEASDPVARLLNAVWRDQEYALRSSDVAFKAFQGLLAWCAGLRDAAALDLQTRIATERR